MSDRKMGRKSARPSAMGLRNGRSGEQRDRHESAGVLRRGERDVPLEMEVVEVNVLQLGAAGQRVEEWRRRGRGAVHEDIGEAPDVGDGILRGYRPGLPVSGAHATTGYRDGASPATARSPLKPCGPCAAGPPCVAPCPRRSTRPPRASRRSGKPCATGSGSAASASAGLLGRSPSCTGSWWNGGDGSPRATSCTRSTSACCCPGRRRSSSRRIWAGECTAGAAGWRRARSSSCRRW